jgi:hypothetical protein
MNEPQAQVEFGSVQGHTSNLTLPDHSQNDLVPPLPSLVHSSEQSHHLSAQALNPHPPELTQVIQQLGVVMLNSVANTILHAQG